MEDLENYMSKPSCTSGCDTLYNNIIDSLLLCCTNQPKQVICTYQNRCSKVDCMTSKFDSMKKGLRLHGEHCRKRVGFVADDERSLILQMLKGERRRQTAAAMMELFCESVLSAPLSRGERMEGQGVDNCGKIQKHACSNLHKVLIPHYICLSSYITSGSKGTL